MQLTKLLTTALMITVFSTPGEVLAGSLDPRDGSGIKSKQNINSREKTLDEAKLIHSDPRIKKRLGKPPAKSKKVRKMDPVKARIAREAYMQRLSVKMKENPKNLDAYFRYADMASKLEKYEEAEKAYLHMLETDSNLKRIKLDLALLYMKMADLDKAKDIFQDVKSGENIPDKVKQNIDNMLLSIENAKKRVSWAGNLSVGLNLDTNANSAASTGESTFSDTSIALDASSRSKRDSSFYEALSVINSFKFTQPSNSLDITLDTTGTLYRTDQRDLNSIDIMLGSIKSGPQFNFKKIGTKIGVNATYSYLKLNRHPYLITTSGEGTLNKNISDKLSFNFSSAYEYRRFRNSDTVTTHREKTGNAYQTKYGLTYLMTPKDLLSAELMFRKENARKLWNSNFQRQFTGTYTRQFPKGFSTVTSFIFKESDYDEFDTSVSTLVIRQDRERTFSFNLAKQLPYNLSLTLGWQYKNATSNIQNYTYKNYRVSSALGWTF